MSARRPLVCDAPFFRRAYLYILYARCNRTRAQGKEKLCLGSPRHSTGCTGICIEREPVAEPVRRAFLFFFYSCVYIRVCIYIYSSREEFPVKGYYEIIFPIWVILRCIFCRGKETGGERIYALRASAVYTHVYIERRERICVRADVIDFAVARNWPCC